MTLRRHINCHALFFKKLSLAILLVIFSMQLAAQVKGIDPEPGRHLVEAKETFYSISKDYNISIDDLKSANPGLLYPRAGEYINIPVKKNGVNSVSQPEEVAEVVPAGKTDPDCKKDKHNLSKNYKVALMVPLSLEAVPGIDTLLTKTPAEEMNLPSFRFLQFYQGFLLAADTLADMGLNLELSIIDSDQDPTKASTAIRSESMKEMDLIVGPFFKNAFSETASFALANNIPIVNPLSAREDILAEYPNVFKIVPSKISQVSVIKSLVDRRFRNFNIFIVTENAYQGADFVASVSTTLSDLLKKSIPTVNYASDSLPGVRSLIRDGVPNLLIMYSETGVLPVQLLPLLNEMLKEKEITIIGLPEWEKFEHLENKYLVSLGAYLFTDSFIDFMDPDVKRFVSDFRFRYLAEPLDYAFDGYDAGLFFLSSLMDYGPGFTGCTRNSDYSLLHTRYVFNQIPGGGYDNIYWNVYHFQDYYLIQVPYLPKSND